MNRKADKLGLEPLKVTYSQIFVEEKVIENPNGTNKIIKVERLPVTIEGSSPKIEGWTFIAKIDHTESNNVVIDFTNSNVHDTYKDVECNCEHCNIKRSRNSTFIVKNEETQKIMQVGSSCLKDFLGHKNPEKVLEFYSWVKNIPSSGNEEVEMREVVRIDTVDAIALCVGSILEFGFKPKSSYGLSTSEDASGIFFDINFNLNPTRIAYAKKRYTEYTTSEKVKEIVSFVKDSYIKELSEKEGKNSFENTVLSILQMDSFKPQYMGYVAAGINAAIKNKIEAKEVSKKSNEWVGKVGEKSQFSVTVVNKSGFDSQFGYTVIYIMETAEGNQVTWFTNGNASFNVEDKLSFIATVKEHKEFKGRKQTVITRPSKIAIQG